MRSRRRPNERLAANTPGNPSFQPAEMQQMHHGMSGMEGMQHDKTGRYENGFGRETDERKSLLHVQNASADSSGQAGEMSDLRPHPDQERRGAEMIRPLFLVLILPLLLVVTVQGQSTEDLRSTIQQRTGKQVEWQRDAWASDQIREAIRALLRRTLTADSAVQVALLNNRELQATFEEIGIAQSRFDRSWFVEESDLRRRRPVSQSFAIWNRH
jgi:hypothetical protein